GGAEREERRQLELEFERSLHLAARRAAARERARHPNRLERLLLQVVRLLGVEREDLKGDLGIGHEQRDDRPDAELLQRLQAVVAVGRPVLVLVTNRDDRIEEQSDL